MKSEKNCLDKCTELPLFLTYFYLVRCIELPDFARSSSNRDRAVNSSSCWQAQLRGPTSCGRSSQVEELHEVCKDERVVLLKRWPSRPCLAMLSVLHGDLLLQILELLVNLSTKNRKTPHHQSTQQHLQEPTTHSIQSVRQAIECRHSQHSAPPAEGGMT